MLVGLAEAHQQKTSLQSYDVCIVVISNIYDSLRRIEAIHN